MTNEEWAKQRVIDKAEELSNTPIDSQLYDRLEEGISRYRMLIWDMEPSEAVALLEHQKHLFETSAGASQKYGVALSRIYQQNPEVMTLISIAFQSGHDYALKYGDLRKPPSSSSRR